MAKQLTGYTYDGGTGRYRNSDTGKFVSRNAIISLLEDSVAKAEKRVGALASDVASGQVTPSGYADSMRDEMRRLHLQQAALAKGGWDRMTQADYGRVGAATRQVYAKIDGSSRDAEEGKASAAQLAQRGKAYAGSARSLFHKIEREQSSAVSPDKVQVERRILDDGAQHCEDCLAHAARGTQIAGMLPVPGEDCQCGHNCRCELRRWEVDASELDSLLGKQRESKRMSDIQITHDAIQLSEAALRADGTMPIKLISPGWGTSGYYSPEVLRRDGPSMFVSGTQMFWDHPTASEENDRPENSLRNLAAILVDDARWDDDGVDGPGLYAEAKAFGDYKPMLDELAPHIGVSIRASGRARTGEVDGRKGPIIEEITGAKSADFVTVAGAGGKIIELFEAARDGRTSTDTDETTISESEDNGMSKELEQQLQNAQEAITKLQEANDLLQQQNARNSEALLMREARDFVAARLDKSTLPGVTKERLTESLAKNPPIVDGALDTEAYTTSIDEAIEAESEYINQIAGASGVIRGMGSTGQQRFSESGSTDNVDHEADEKRLVEAFGALGLEKDEVDFAVNGRG